MKRPPLVLSVLALVLARTSWALDIETVYGVLSSGKPLEVTAGEVLVKFDPAVPGPERAVALAGAGASVIGEFDGKWVHARLPAGMRVSSALTALKSLPGVLDVQPNRVFRPVRKPGDPQSSSQYHFSNINAFSAWEYETGSSSRTTVAVLDSGIEGTHPDLSAKLSGMPHMFFNPVASSTSAEVSPTAACDHATMVAGIAAADTDNGTGVAGMSWGAKLLSLRVFRTQDCSCDLNCNASCQSACGTNETAIRAAIDYAAGLHNTATAGKMVVNMSLGAACACGSGCGAASDGVLPTAIANAYGKGVTLIAAAGNDGGGVNSPANCVNVIPVGATDSGNNVASFSSRGAELAANGVVAPGVGLVTTYLNAGYTAAATGTSFSAPIVSGLASLILSRRPDFGPAEVKNALRGSAGSIGVSSLGAASLEPLGNSSGAGLVNAFAAMRLAVNGTLSDFQGLQKAIAFPNPFRPSRHGTATITVPTSIQGRSLKIKLYTMDGQLVRDLGAKTTWDGRNDNGTPVASGVYIFLVSTDSGMQKGRVALIR